MHECYAMQIPKKKKKKKKKKKTNKAKTTKRNGHKEQRDQAQGPCQNEPFQMQLLHWSYYSHWNAEQLQDWNKGLKPLPIHQ